MTKRGTKVLSHERFARVRQPDATVRELSTVREIAHALAHADRPDEVFQFALDRTTALIGASFASVYLVEGVSELMRLVAASNWPERHRPWLSEMRVRLGFGPSGESAAERRIIEVPDVQADGGLEDWAEVGRELGFRSLVALPLQDARSALGAVTFYFAEPGVPPAERRQLMRLVADQMAAAAVRSQLVSDLRRTAAALSEARDEVEGLMKPRVALPDDGSGMDAMVGAIAPPLAAAIAAAKTLRVGETLSDAGTQPLMRALEQVQATLDDWQEIFALRNGALSAGPDVVAPRELA
ncbi:MAG: GAF domain-containing protein, partial [Gemmatimonadetes bacterium]|nr:GAF domain-containing protein [Gemmatimonadota bacterium]